MRDKIKLLSTAGTGHFYTTTKNKRLHPEKLEVKKSFRQLAKTRPDTRRQHQLHAVVQANQRSVSIPFVRLMRPSRHSEHCPSNSAAGSQRLQSLRFW